MRRLCLLVVFALVTGCRASEPPAPAPSAGPPPRLVGCGAVYRDGACALPADGALSIFVPGAPPALAVEVDGARTPHRTRAVPGGALVSLDVGGPSALVLRAGDEPLARWTLRPPEPAVPDDEAALVAALAGADAVRRGLIESALARRRLRAGDVEAAQARFAAAEAAHAAVGRVSAIARDLEAQTYVALYHTVRFDDARALLGRHGPVAPDAYGEASAAYLGGLLAWRTGDALGALAGLTEARRGYEQIGATREVLGAVEAEAIVLRALGRGEVALERLADVAARLPADAQCDRARLALNTGWVQTLERSRRGRGVDPRPALTEAHAAFSTGACASRGAQRNAALNLALAALEMGEPAESRRWLATLPADDAALRGWRLDIEGRLALLGGDPASAIERFTALAALAGPATPETLWRAEMGVGDAHWLAGETDAALAAWRRAEQALDAEALRLPVDGDRAYFVADRARSARRLVAALVEQGRAAEALCAARLARGRSLTAVARRDRIAGLDETARRR